MSKNDELDRRRAAAFAWRFTRPGEVIDLPDDGLDQAPGGDDADAAHADEANDGYDFDVEDAAELDDAAEEPRPAGEGFFREAHDTCAVLAVEIDRVWTMPVTEQAAALEPLILRAGELGLGLCAMQYYPLQSIRLLRLALRCRAGLSPDAWEAAWSSAAWLDYDHPELPDLLIEAAHAGAQSLVTAFMLAISDARWKEVVRMPGAIERIARVIDEGPGYTARRIAVNWIACAGGRAAVPALRRALRAPHFVLRYRALDVLDQRFPERIQAEDVIFLLEDALVHAPPDRYRDEETERAHVYVPGMLERAVVRLRPQGAIAPLLRIIECEGATRWRYEPCLDEAWALRVLAAAFPEVALPHVDPRLRHVSRDRREMATEAAGRLPDALARPRLLLVAADGVPEIAERAQALWLERYAELCPMDPMAGVETALLDGPPSDQMRSRLGVLRTAPLEARAAMVEVLLGEAPDPEALALLLFAAIDSRIWERRIRPGLPDHREAYCRALLERFGARAITGVLALEARYPEGRYGWLQALGNLLGRDGLPEETHAALRARAAERLIGADGRTVFDALLVLDHVSPPPELADTMWRIACDASESPYGRHVAVRALGRLPAGTPLDAAVQAEMEAALAAPDLPRFANALAAGMARELPAAGPLAERALAEHGGARPEDPRIIEALAECMRELGTARLLPETFLRDALGRSGTCLAAAAARYARRQRLGEPELAALTALLSDSDPACAAEAACTLLGPGPEAVDVGRPELRDIAARAPLALRGEMIFRMHMRGAPLSELWSLIEPILVSADPLVSESLHNLTYELEKQGMGEKMRALLPQVVDPELRMDIEDLFARQQDPYWEDREGEDEDEDPLRA